MKEELQGKLVEILTGIQAAVGKASDFALDQLPDIAMQYVLWGRASESVYMFIFIAVFISCIFSVRWAFKHQNDFEDVHGFAMIYGLGGSIVSLILILANLSSLLLVWVAPKVWLIKEIARIVK